MKTFKLLVKEIEQLPQWEGELPKDQLKLGIVSFNFKGKTDDYEFDLKKGDEVFYQYGTNAKLDGVDYVLVSLTSLVCQK